MSMTEVQYNYIQHIGLFILERYPLSFSSDVAYFIGCQFAFESGYGTSNLSIKYNNHCGMKVVHNRVTTQLPSDGKLKFGSYPSLSACIIDYLVCLLSHKITKNQTFDLEKFIRSIDGWYCPNRYYLDEINRIYLQFKSYQNGKSKS